jgi:ABC-type Fe3+ transport system permease subunit
VSFFCLFLLLSSATVCAATSESDAAAKVSEAQSAVNSAFAAVQEAEQAGANITSLLSFLNETVGLLSNAEVAYKNGDLNGSVYNANQCIKKANVTLNDALALKSSASESAQGAFWSTLLYSLVGAAAFAVVLFLVWGWFSRRYVNRLLRMKPAETNLRGSSAKKTVSEN